mmetsp:Transcript_15691/g.49293  ORF Transcript_15691/g.49293 Transcript_15691/m.49293 type:complete len:263 (-) Transcript_15691:1649-2437(-)
MARSCSAKSGWSVPSAPSSLSRACSCAPSASGHLLTSSQSPASLVRAPHICMVNSTSCPCATMCSVCSNMLAALASTVMASSCCPSTWVASPMHVSISAAAGCDWPTCCTMSARDLLKASRASPARPAFSTACPSFFRSPGRRSGPAPERVSCSTCQRSTTSASPWRPTHARNSPAVSAASTGSSRAGPRGTPTSRRSSTAVARPRQLRPGARARASQAARSSHLSSGVYIHRIALGSVACASSASHSSARARLWRHSRAVR